MKQLVIFNTSFNFYANRWSKKFIALSWTQQNERLFLHHKFGSGRSLSYSSCWKIFKVCITLVNYNSYDIFINKLYTLFRLHQKDFLHMKLLFFFYLLSLILELQSLRLWRSLNRHWAWLPYACFLLTVISDRWSLAFAWWCTSAQWVHCLLISLSGLGNILTLRKLLFLVD